MPETRTAIPRAYRPRRLDQLIGQDVLVKTLQGAFAHGRTVQAYLLTGPRGTGKTSTARILASCFNCADGPTATPCGTCAQCTAIAREQHMDVLEIDAASYTGVDNVRDLQQSLRYAPAQGRTKLVIVDEVHMLSKGAFNALLKTLEEPPAHVVFVFATTEPRKIPATILSRCQRFDLRPVDPETLKHHYAEVCRHEGVDAEDAALDAIAKAARGSVRDGLSVLGQAMAAEGAVSLGVVREMLALGDAVAAADLLRRALSGDDHVAALTAMRSLWRAGADPAQVVVDMLHTIHAAALTTTAPGSAGDAGVEPEIAEAAAEIASAIDPRRAHFLWRALADGLEDVRTLPDPQRAAEMTLLRCIDVAGGSKT